jgi:SAM-dependent methyltransferase
MTLEATPRVETFLAEYSADDMIARYISRTAGAGVVYALTNIYAPVYSRVIRSLMTRRPEKHKFRVLEYGCGGGMNLLKILELLFQRRAEVEIGIGADFSSRMIQAAREDARVNFPPHLNDKIHFVVARNETLATDLANSLESSVAQVEGSFDIVVGVNTFRYCHRLEKEADCAQDIFRLLRPGGYSIMIDMNSAFPLFRSRLPDLLRRPGPEAYLPRLAEYRRPFELAGFEIIETRNFCWVPHSATPRLVAVCKTFAPALDRWLSRFAMRSLVVGERPA